MERKGRRGQKCSSIHPIACVCLVLMVPLPLPLCVSTSSPPTSVSQAIVSLCI